MRLPGELVVVVVAAVAISDCLDPTEIELVLSTDVPCASVRNVAISVGAADDDKRAVNTVTPNCSDDGGIGTLFIVPSHGPDDVVGIRATLGVTADSDKCIEPKFAGCIVARRSLHYIAHRRLTLPVELDQACLDNACTPDSTCVHGTCVDAGATCPNDECNVPDDGGTIDAGSCNDIGPVLVNPMSTKVVPHIVKLTNGYAVGFETAVSANPRLFVVAAVSATGVATPPVVAANISQPFVSGPLGTDGINYATIFQSGAGAITERVVDPSGTLVGVTASSGVFIGMPVTGLFHTALPGQYLFLTTDGTQAPELASFDSTGSFSSASIDLTIHATNLALANFGATYLATFTDTSSCYLSGCTFPPVACTKPQAFASCTSVRAALQPIGTLVATRNNVGSVTSGNLFFAATPTSAVGFGDVDDQAIVTIASAGAFELVWSSGGTIQAEGVGAGLIRTLPNPIATVSMPAFFDAVADDPNATGYGVTYFDDRATVPGVYFVHKCK